MHVQHEYGLYDIDGTLSTDLLDLLIRLNLQRIPHRRDVSLGLQHTRRQRARIYEHKSPAHRCSRRTRGVPKDLSTGKLGLGAAKRNCNPAWSSNLRGGRCARCPRIQEQYDLMGKERAVPRVVGAVQAL